jgi:uncharacterized membrane protein YsdA (DUF1294 family)
MTEEERYQSAWRDRNRRSLLAILLMLGGAGILIAPPFIASKTQMEKLVTPLLIFIAIWCLAMLASVIYAARFRCPRCDHRFSAHQKGPRYMPYCTNCGLPVGSGLTLSVDPKFKKSN